MSIFLGRRSLSSLEAALQPERNCAIVNLPQDVSHLCDIQTEKPTKAEATDSEIHQDFSINLSLG
jgi:hypothetical protein